MIRRKQKLMHTHMHTHTHAHTPSAPGQDRGQERAQTGHSNRANPETVLRGKLRYTES